VRALARFDLEYVEQPCRSVEELADLRRRLVRAGVHVRIAADESIRRVADPYRVRALEAADVAVLKVQPLGGVRACLEVAERIGLPVVVSSALETSIGIRAGLALAAALPELPFACGLNTVRLLAEDLVAEPLVAVGGMLPVAPLRVSAAALAGHAAPAATAAFWQARLVQTRELAATRPDARSRG
jgi:O-succinylbenzoate synthase